MHRRVNHYSTYRFYILYSMMHNRKINIKLMNIGDVEVRKIFDLMKYTDTYNEMKD